MKERKNIQRTCRYRTKRPWPPVDFIAAIASKNDECEGGSGGTISLTNIKAVAGVTGVDSQTSIR